MMTPKGKPMMILLVEDDPGHATLVQMNLETAGLSNQIHHVKDGQQAIEFIFNRKTENVGEKQPPLLILLDLNLPVLDGYQVLEQLKADATTRHIPVIILTTTEDEREIKRCYELGCSIYLNKPVEYDAFQEAIHQLGLFLGVIKLPD